MPSNPSAFLPFFTRGARWLAAIVAVAWLALALPALAAPVSDADEKDVRSVVQAQLAAFAADDAEGAFSYAAPEIRASLGSAARFMAMVRSQYAVVYRPATVAFMKPEGKDDAVIQRVQMTDTNDLPWLAVYTLQLQPDKLWRITGCVITQRSARMA